MAMISTAVTITAAGQYSPPVDIKGEFNFFLDGVFDGVVDLQRSYDNGATWVTFDSYTSSATDLGEFAPNDSVKVRIGSSNFTSGTAIARISQ